jgi:hypothetical protein
MRHIGLLAAAGLVLAANSVLAQPGSEAQGGPAYPTSLPATALPGPVNAAQPPLLDVNAPREDIIRWLGVNAPSSKGRTVYVSGGEAFWIEHIDRDPKSAMKLVATVHTEYFGDLANDIRSVYQVTQYDCEKQTQYTIYVRSYLGAGLTGEARKDTPILRMNTFISPISADFPHIRAVCLPVYDTLHKRTYALTVPG